MQALTPAMSASRPSSARSKGFLWFALVLLVVSVCINYIDRGNLSVAGTDVSKEFGADPQQMGKLYSAFFFTYAFSQVFAGWLIDRINVNWLYAGGYLIWSGATALTGLVTGYEMLFALRLLLGMAESVSYPCYSKIIAGGFPEQQRGVANSLIDAGSKAGPALGVLICGTLLSHYGWRTMFLIIGGVSMAWLIPWVYVAINQKVDTGRAFSGPAPSMQEILSKRSAWGTFIGLFCYNYTWYFLITWLPSYLEKERHYTKDMLSTFGSLPFWGVAVSSLCAGTLSDALIRRGASPTKVRKGFLVTGLAMATLVLPANLVQDQRISMGILIVACLSMGLASSNIWALTQRLAGRGAAGKWTGLQNGFGNLAGVVAPWLTGWTVHRSGSFFFAFVVAAGIVILGAMAYLWIVGDIEEIRWGEQVSEPLAE
jgi:ACS family D-galactonate transporter-like MFS transporter